MSFSLKRDAKYPNMYRIQRSDGTLSDMSNQVRAKEALAVVTSLSPGIAP